MSGKLFDMRKMRRRLLFYAIFVVAIAALSRLVAAVNVAMAEGTVEAWARAAGVFAILLVAFLYLGFILYEADRAAGRVKRHFRLYEWWIRGK